MKCPHCLVEIHESWTRIGGFSDGDGSWSVEVSTCPACNRATVLHQRYSQTRTSYTIEEEVQVRPIGSARRPAPTEVPAEMAEDYDEACKVAPFSQKAAAALARRCLQATLHARGIKKPNLAGEIDEFINAPSTPSHLAESVDAIRNIGNFAAHPMKSTQSGQILAVETGEVDWMLDVLEELFDFQFVQPTRVKAKRAALDAKLAEAGKKPMK